MADRQYHLQFGGNAAASVDAYAEYKRIVGDDDGGQTFTPEQYAEYKKKVLPMRQKNRLYTSWTNSSGMDCKQVGPETPCFCEHRYKQHRTDFPTVPDARPILLPCKAKGCKCVSYHYIPLMGGQPIRCTCKHLANDHSPARPYLCTKSICQKCAGFKSSYTCGCGEPYTAHEMIVETRDEREARGHPVGHDTPYAAMGGLTGFSSLAEGYMRLDPSGRGAPTEEYLSQEISANDHVFLRNAVPSVQSYRKAVKDYDKLDEDMSERMSAMRMAGESDMDYFERRYLERRRNEDMRRTRAVELPKEERPRTGSRKPAGGAPKTGAKKPTGAGRGKTTTSKPGAAKEWQS